MTSLASDKPIAYECRSAFYSRSHESDEDIHFVKEIAHYADGRKVPQTRIIKNYQRQFWVTKKGFQNHKSKKEREELSKLNEFKTTQTKLAQSVARALGMPGFRGTLRDLSNSPYLYGSDIDSTALIKQYYMDRFPDVKSPYSVAVFDTETDMVDGNKQIIMATISYKEKVYTAVTDHFVRKYGNPVDHIKSLANKYLGEILTKRNIVLDIEIVDSEIDVLFKTIGKAHEWKPDFVAAWNMLFDLEKIEEACKRADVDIADLFCDPSVPPEFRRYKLKVGPAKKITSSGVVQVFKPSQRWHYVFAPASFVWVDAMCAYRQIRQGQAEEPSYALDSILFKHLGMRKLSFEQADHITNKAQWHVFMQSQYPLEYVVYNIFDCIGVELLDEETVDLQVKLPLYSGCSDFSRFNSQPRRKVDKLHSFQLKYDPPHVIGSTGAKMSDEFDEMTWGLDDWIVMLPSHPITDSGLCLIEEDPTLRTTIRIGTSDLDVRAAYPTGEDVANISKETTVRELVKIHGADTQIVRMNVINFSAGHVNALEFCNDILHMPNLDEMLNAYLLSTGRTVEGCGVSQVKKANIYLN